MAGDNEADVDLDSIVAAARQRSPGHRGGRSPVYDLMWDHHAHLAPELGRLRRPNWAAVAQALGNQGVLDGAGQALSAASAETVRKTWWKVCRDKETVVAGTTGRRRAKRGQATPLPPSPASAGPTGGNKPLPPGIEPEEPDPPEGRYQFRFAGGPKIWTKDEPKPE
jgi:hypothetical protein